MAESLKHVILRMAEERGEGSFTPIEAAQELRPPRPEEVKGDEKWRGFVRQVRAEAKGLARQGRIDIMRARGRCGPGQADQRADPTAQNAGFPGF